MQKLTYVAVAAANGALPPHLLAAPHAAARARRTLAPALALALALAPISCTERRYNSFCEAGCAAAAPFKIRGPTALVFTPHV